MHRLPDLWTVGAYCAHVRSVHRTIVRPCQPWSGAVWAWPLLLAGALNIAASLYLLITLGFQDGTPGPLFSTQPATYQATALSLLRDAGHPHMVAAPGGMFQHSMKEGRTYQLLRLRIDDSDGLVPEITGHRLMVQVRLMRPDADGRLRPAPVDQPFELALCA